MSNGSQTKGYLLAALLGAVCGGILVAVATKAIPTIMAGMMKTMMAQMKTCACCSSGDM